MFQGERPVTPSKFEIGFVRGERCVVGKRPGTPSKFEIGFVSGGGIKADGGETMGSFGERVELSKSGSRLWKHSAWLAPRSFEARRGRRVLFAIRSAKHFSGEISIR